jgi:hypothetical protein
MKKFIIRFFLSLCILFLSGYSQWYAHAYESRIHSALINSPETSEKASLDNKQQSLTLINHAGASHREKKKFKIEATEVTEEEDEQSSSLKRNAKNKYFFTTLFYNSLVAYFFSSLKVALPYSKQFPAISSYRRHLLFQIFRI